MNCRKTKNTSGSGNLPLPFFVIWYREEILCLEEGSFRDLFPAKTAGRSPL